MCEGQFPCTGGSSAEMKANREELHSMLIHSICVRARVSFHMLKQSPKLEIHKPGTWKREFSIAETFSNGKKFTWGGNFPL